MVLVGQVVGANNAVKTWAVQPAREIGRERNRAGKLLPCLTGKREQSLCRSVVADAAAKRRGQQPGRPVTRARPRRAQRGLHPADHIAPPAEHGTCLAAVGLQLSGQVDVHALAHRAGRAAGEARQRQARVGNGKRRSCGPREIEASGGPAADAEAGHEGIDECEIDVVDPAHQFQAFAICSDKPDTAIAQLDPHRQQLVAAPPGHDPRRTDCADVDPPRAAGEHHAPEPGLQVRVDGDAQRHAAGALDQCLCRAATVAVIDLAPRGGNVERADPRPSDLHIGNDPGPVEKHDRGIDDGPVDSEPCRSGQDGAARAKLDQRLLMLAARRKPDKAFHALTACCQFPGVGAGSVAAQRAGQDDPAKLGAVDDDTGKFACAERHVRRERPVIGLAPRIEAVSAGRAGNPCLKPGQSDAKAGPLGAHHRVRVGERARDPDPDRSVGPRDPAGDQREPAVWPIGALTGGDAHQRRFQPQPGEAHHAVRAIAHVGGCHAVAAKEVRHAIVQQPGGARAKLAGQREARAPRPQIKVGLDVEHGDAFQPVIIQRAIDRAGIVPSRHVARQHQSGVEPVGSHTHVVRQDAPALDGNVAIERDSGKRPAGQ